MGSITSQRPKLTSSRPPRRKTAGEKTPREHGPLVVPGVRAQVDAIADGRMSDEGHAAMRAAIDACTKFLDTASEAADKIANGEILTREEAAAYAPFIMLTPDELWYVAGQTRAIVMFLVRGKGIAAKHTLAAAVEHIKHGAGEHFRKLNRPHTVPISEIGIPTQVVNKLETIGIYTVGDLKRTSDEEIRGIEGLDLSRIADVRLAVANWENGLEFEKAKAAYKAFGGVV